MRVRIQPREIDVPEENPFRHDLLGRKEAVEVLTRLVGNIEGPCVLAVDAAWGNGKTTFLNIWTQYLCNDGFPVVKFNAWETDFSGDPFIALSTELREGLERYATKYLEPKITDLKKKITEVARRAVPGIFRVATAGILDINPLLEKEIGQALASYAEARLSEYQEAQKSVKAFRQTLQDIANTVSNSKGKRPIIVVIDELDRCRPSYAVELLEVAKHLFAVDHIVFVMAVNRSELAHSVKALYGNDFDAEGYLRRFFDVDFRLPEPERDAFINEAFKAIQIERYFIRTDDQRAKQDAETVRNMLLGFFRAPDLSLRRIAQALHRLGLVFGSLRSNCRSFAPGVAVALILRTIDADLYHRFLDGEVSDLDVVDTVFARPGAEAFRLEEEGRLFEAVTIMAAQEFEAARKGGLGLRQRHLRTIKTPLARKYLAIVSASSPDSNDRDREHAQQVLDSAADMWPSYGPIQFRDVVNRLELLSADLIG